MEESKSAALLMSKLSLSLASREATHWSIGMMICGQKNDAKAEPTSYQRSGLNLKRAFLSKPIEQRPNLYYDCHTSRFSEAFTLTPIQGPSTMAKQRFGAELEKLPPEWQENPTRVQDLIAYAPTNQSHTSIVRTQGIAKLEEGPLLFVLFLVLLQKGNLGKSSVLGWCDSDFRRAWIQAPYQASCQETSNHSTKRRTNLQV